MRSRSLALIILAATALAGCATFKPPQISYDDEQPALLEGEPPKPVQVVEIAKPLPLPVQLNPLRGMVITELNLVCVFLVFDLRIQCSIRRDTPVSFGIHPGFC